MAKTGVTPKQHRAINALLTEPTITAAALAAKVGLRTLMRWLDNPAFLAALRRAQQAALNGAIRRLAHASGEAVTVLVDGMHEDAVQTRIRAADLVLGRLPALAQLHDLEERVAKLEDRVLDVEL
jgi:phage terminase small subunit